MDGQIKQKQKKTINDINQTIYILLIVYKKYYC